MSNNDDKSKELADIKTQFYAIMENYPTMYANSKMTPNLPSAMNARDKTDAALTSLHNRMFMFKATLDKELDDNEDTMAQLAKRGAQLNAKIARRTSSLDSKDAMISQAPSTDALVQASNTQTKVIESFVNGATQLPGCVIGSDGNPSNCPCVPANSNVCDATCRTQNKCPATANEISLVSEARDIEMKSYFYAISRIVYLFVGIFMVSYFIFQTVGMPDSTILNDAKIKAEQIKMGITNKTSNLINNANVTATATGNATANAFQNQMR